MCIASAGSITFRRGDWRWGHWWRYWSGAGEAGRQRCACRPFYRCHRLATRLVHPLHSPTCRFHFARIHLDIAARGTILLFILPLLPHPAPKPVAVVDAPNCNGCSRCLVDCPYAAVTMEPHPDKPGHKIAIVDADLCASCGICAGSCPSSTPFRSQEALVTGIDMPQLPVSVLRRSLEEKSVGSKEQPESSFSAVIAVPTSSQLKAPILP